MPRIAGVVAGLCMLALAGSLAAAGVERFALVVGANQGGRERPTLKYAVSDAERFARVLGELGGVAAERTVLLRQPSAPELEAALLGLRARVNAVRRGALRTEVLVYYSGHADEQGLLLGESRYSYRDLRDQLEQTPADVRIAILDACESGAITRLKGGQQRQPFLVDASADMHGYAFLTSSSADEAAQESDRIGASYFTHYLVSGLRGAADTSGEGVVTLNEAYQFAFGETLGRTSQTRQGPQHPSYDIKLSGTGDVIMTDLRATSAALLLGEELGGRCLIRDSEQRLVVELQKPRGRRVELGLAPGSYDVHCQDDQNALDCKPTLVEGQRLVLGASDFAPGKREPSVARGGTQEATLGWFDGRNRLELRGNYYDASSGGSVPAENYSTTIAYSHWLRPNLAVEAVSTLIEQRYYVIAGPQITTDNVDVFSLLGGARLELSPRSRVRPYVAGALGLYTADRMLEVIAPGLVSRTKESHTVFGGDAGAGLDVQLSRGFMLGGRVNYAFMGDLPEAMGGRKNYSGLQVGFSVSWLIGRGRPPKP